MDLREMKTFITVQQLGSFSKAAHKLGYTQAAVTVQIKNLERELNTKLFDRLNKQIRLTNEGEVFYKYSVHILNDVIEATEALACNYELQGSLSVGIIDSLCSTFLPNLLRQYHSKHKKVSVTVLNDTPAELFNRLNCGQLDFLYVLEEKIINSCYIKLLEIKEDVSFVCSSTHRLCNMPAMEIDEILNFPFILTEDNASYRKLLDLEMLKINKKIQPFIQAQNTDLICQMLIDNDYISFLPNFLVKDCLEKNILTTLDVPEINIDVYRQILYHKEKWVTKEMKSFFDLLEQ
ncbi:MAG: LysR family transcriptional regulator [Lachnospirales bacterium]